MILLVDIKPSLARDYQLDSLNFNKKNLAKASPYYPSGSGIELLDLLNVLNEQGTITGFTGGSMGPIYEESLRTRAFSGDFIRLRDEMALEIKLIDSQGETTGLIDQGPRITREEEIQFYNFFDSYIDNFNIIMAAGDRPLGFNPEFYKNIGNMSLRKNKEGIFSLGGEDLGAFIEDPSGRLIISREDLESVLGLKLNFNSEVIRASKFILDRGCRSLLVYLGQEGCLYLGQDYAYKIDSREEMKVNEERFKKGFLAGFSVGLKRLYEEEVSLRLAMGLGLAWGMEENLAFLDMANIKQIMGQCDLYKINY